jgi:hypothetical protein
MDLAAARTALRIPEPLGQLPDTEGVVTALAGFTAAAARKARADAEAAISRRPSTLKATLKSTLALEKARQHVLAELRLVGYLADAVPMPRPSTDPDSLRRCG